MKIARKLSLLIGKIFAVFIISLFVLNFLNHYEIFSVDTRLAGFDYLPPLVLLILALPVSLGFVLLKKRWAGLIFLVVVILFFITLGDVSMRFVTTKSLDKEAGYEKLSVLTYNVRYYSFGIEKIADFLDETHADVYLLCESVLDEQRKNYLEENLPEYSLISDNGHDTAILSRHPVLRYEIVQLPSFLASLSGSNDLEELTRKNQHRAFVHAVIDLNGTPVNVLSVRLIAGRAKDKSIKESYKWGRYLLQAQEQEQQTFLNYISKLNGPIVFGGDLNAPSSARVIKNFRKIARDAYLSDHLFGNFTFRTNMPSMRLDYIFHTPDLITVDSKIIRTRLSDHFPVKCDLLVPRTSSLAFK